MIMSCIALKVNMQVLKLCYLVHTIKETSQVLKREGRTFGTKKPLIC